MDIARTEKVTVTKMPILRIILTAAIPAIAAGAAVYAIVTVAIRITDLKELYIRFREWEKVEKEIEASNGR